MIKPSRESIQLVLLHHRLLVTLVTLSTMQNQNLVVNLDMFILMTILGRSLVLFNLIQTTIMLVSGVDHLEEMVLSYQMYLIFGYLMVLVSPPPHKLVLKLLKRRLDILSTLLVLFSSRTTLNLELIRCCGTFQMVGLLTLVLVHSINRLTSTQLMLLVLLPSRMMLLSQLIQVQLETLLVTM